ncbi:hypothetical protein BGZ73_005947 [Actinomortierella ambigua]|nr:hypothetical protein BGZ73_005947 [Actinomortierella ambigua]
MQHSSLYTQHTLATGPPTPLTIPEILERILIFVVSAEPIPPDPVRDRPYVTKSTHSKQALANLRSILLVCKQWHDIGLRIHLWPTVWSNRTATSRAWWDSALGLTPDTRGHHHLRLVCFFEGQALVRDSIWSKRYAWKEENHGYWIQWLEDMRRIQQHEPPSVYTQEASSEDTGVKGEDDLSSPIPRPTAAEVVTGIATHQLRLNVKELVVTGHFEVHTHVAPLLMLPGIASQITLLELRFHHYTIIDPRLFFHVPAERQDDGHQYDLPPIPHLRHLILGKVQFRENVSSLRPQAPQPPIGTWWIGPQPNVVIPPSEAREQLPQFKSTTDLLLHIAPKTPNLSRISIETVNTVHMLLTLSQAFPRVEYIDNYVSRYIRTKDTRGSVYDSPIATGPPQSLGYPPLPLPRPTQGLASTTQQYFLTSIKIPIWRGGNVEAGRNLDDLMGDNAGFGTAALTMTASSDTTGSAAAAATQLVDPEWDWFQFFQTEQARHLKELQLPSHMLAIGYLDPARCPRWTCEDLEDLTIEFYPGSGRNGGGGGGNGGGHSHHHSSHSDGLESSGNGSTTASVTRTTAATSARGGAGGGLTMSSTLEMSRRVLSFIVTSFPRLRRLTIWRSCVNLSDDAGGMCFVSRLAHLESLTLKANHKHLWYWPRVSEAPFEAMPRWLVQDPTDHDRARGRTSLQLCRTVASLDGEEEGESYFATPHGKAMLWPEKASSSSSSSWQPKAPELEEGCLWRNMREIRISVLDQVDGQEEYLNTTCDILRRLRPDINVDGC